jgi:hypothetical protein
VWGASTLVLWVSRVPLQVIDIPNSMTVLPELIPYSIEMVRACVWCAGVGWGGVGWGGVHRW